MSEEPEMTSEVTEPQAGAEQPVRAAPSAQRERPARRGHRPRAEGITWPVLLILAGVILLLYTTGRQAGAAWWRLWALWPALLILIGLDIWLGRAAAYVRMLVALAALVVLGAAAMYLITLAGGEARNLTCPTGEARQGRVLLEMGVGRLQVSASDRPPVELADVMLQGPPADLRCYHEGEVASLEVRQRQGEGLWGPAQGDIVWMLDLARAVPLQSLAVKVGVGDSNLDLSALNLQDLRLEMGVGRTRVTLPGPEGAPATTVSLRSGVGSIEVTIPPGMAAEIRVDAGLGHVSVDQSRFPWRDGVYRSDGYGTAAYRLQIDIRSAVGGVTVK